MHPDLITIGPLTLHTYGLLIAIGFIVGLFVAIRMGRRYSIDSQNIMDMGFLLIISGVIGARITYVLMNFSDYRANPLDMIKLWQGGLVFSGGLVAAIIVSFFYMRHYKLKILQISDIWAPAIAIGQAIGRVGCFMAGCCYGKQTNGFCSVVFTNPKSIAPLNVPLHPTQLYDCASNLIIFVILIILSAKKKFDGQVFLWFLILHSTARLVIERFRGDDRGIFLGTNWTVTQFIAILILLSSISTLVYLKSKIEKNAGRL
jgi:phosphatidylglycerol---prolipoprotein diacylglyceryl transferase